MIDTDRAYYSRFQVLCSERAAWAQPTLRRKTHFRFDGRRFWRCHWTGEKTLLPSWRAPRYGWAHESSCDCRLCGAHDTDATAGQLAS